MIDLIVTEAATALSAVLVGLGRLLPFLLVSIPLAVFLNHSNLSARMREFVNRGPVLSIFLATLVGAVSPLCSCGVIPAIVALLAGGVPLGPVMAFWIASPSMDPEVLVLSAGVLGWDLALWRLAATFAMSLGAGLVTHALELRGVFSAGILRARLAGSQVEVRGLSVAAGQPALASTGAAQPVGLAGPADPGQGGQPAAVAACSACRTAGGAAEAAGVSWVSRIIAPAHLRSVAKEAWGTGLRLVLFMALAFVLEALIPRILPAEAVAAVVGRSSPWAIPLATLVSVPLYTTNLTALGLISGLLLQGMSPAAALSFLVGGAVTTIPAMAAVFGVVRARVFGLYLSFAAGGALLTGLGWQLAHLGG